MSSLLAATAGLFIGASALAGPLNRALVDKEANWLVHVDVEAGARSSLAGWAAKNVAPDQLAKVEDCKKKFGMGPIDIKAITIYGLDLEDDGVAVLTTTGAADALAVKLPDAGVEELKARVDGNVHYFSFKLEGKAWQAAVRPSGPDERLVLVAASAASLERGLKVITGSTPNLLADAAAINNVVATAQPEKGSLVFVAVRNLSNQRNVNASLLRNTKTLVVDFGEAGGANGQEFFATVLVTAQNNKVAQELGQAMQGMIALGSMAARQHEVPGLVDSLRGVNLSIREDEVALTSRERSDQVLKKLDLMKVMIEQEVANNEGARSVKAAKENGEKPGGSRGSGPGNEKPEGSGKASPR